jgi:hypothetical protein
MTEMPKAGRIITLDNLHQHVLDLAADLRIKWTDWPPRADPEVRTVHLRPIKSETAYAAALHEIGHIRTGRFDDVLIEERRAWEWAQANALVWTPTMQREADSCMGHYEAGTDDADLSAYYNDEICAKVEDLLGGGNPDGELVYDALIGKAVEIAVLYERDEARRVLIQLIDKHLAAY